VQTILGANGQIAAELARELKRGYTDDIRLVSRKPRKVNDSDLIFPADLLDKEVTEKSVKGSDIVYLTVGLPMNAQLWEDQFPLIMENTIHACKKYGSKLVFFDNTYMYAKTNEPQTEESSFGPIGKKSFVRARIATLLLDEIKDKKINAVICRAPEFYGPNKTQSITNSLIFDKIKYNQRLKVPISAETKRTLIWTPDASRAMALIGNTADAYDQTWHLPCDDNRLTYKELIHLISQIYNCEFDYSVIKMWQFKLGSLFNKKVRELIELLPRYKYDNIFISDKFKERFPDFEITSISNGITQIKKEKNY